MAAGRTKSPARVVRPAFPGASVGKTPDRGSLFFKTFASRASSFISVVAMSLRERTRPGLGIIEPCLPSPAKAPPSGPGWIHEIKHDGFRIMARRDGASVRLIILLLIFLLVASSAKAQTSNRTGNWLYTVCAASDQGGQLVCQMWLSGFQAGIISSQNLAQVNKLKPASCIPQDVTADQAKIIIEKFLKDNPQYMQLSAEMVATYALVIAFPCR